jgi:hypothetical protein
MSFGRCGLLFGVLLLAGAASVLPARDAAAGAPEPPLMPPAGKKVDPGKLPGDGLIEITPEKLQELLDEIARLKGKLKTPPAKCYLLNGRVEDGFALFKVDFVFHAERPDAVIALACGQAKVKAAQQQDGRTPILTADADGFLVQVEKPGDYTVTLDVSLALTQRAGGGRGFELDLPRAVVTRLEMDLPADARAPHVNGKDLSETSLTLKNNRLEGPLGPESKLEVTWQGTPPVGVAPLLTARARVVVRIEDGAWTTTADLILHAQGGPVKQWVVVTPPGFEVKPSPADQQRVQSVNRADVPGAVQYTVQLKDPSDADLTLTATALRAPLTAGKRALVGPFLVRGASRQSGMVLVSAAGVNAGLVLHPHADLSARDLTDDERRADPRLTAAYEYGVAPSSQPWLEVEAGSTSGSLKTRTVYTFTLGRIGAGPPEWRLTADFTVSPAVDRLDVQLPSSFELLSAAPDEVEKVEPNKDRVAHIKLAKDSAGSSRGSIKGRYTATPPAAVPGKPASLSLSLPRPLATRDANPQIDVNAPEDVELAAPADVELAVKEVHKLRWFPRETPAEAIVAWKPYQPEMHVSSVIDVTLHSQTAEVLQELHLRFPRTAPKQLTLRIPESIGRGLEVLGGASLVDDPAPLPAAGGGWMARALKLQGTGLDQLVTLKYGFPIPEKTFDVPLAVVELATDGDAHVRVWGDSGRLPLPPGGAWSEQDVEVVQGKNRLPVLVLASTRPDAPLRLTLSDSPSEAAATVLVDRALFRAALEDGDWDFRASYLVRQLANPILDVELPPGESKLKVTFDGHEVSYERVEESVQGGATRRLARLRLGTAFVQKPAVLEVDFKVQTGRTSNGAGPTTLQPPLLVGDLLQAPTRWQVTLPSDCVPLAPEGGATARWTLGWRGWLPAPRQAAVNADLERWFAGADAPDWPEGTADHPSLVCWQVAGQPLTVVYLPEWAWLAICSLPLLLLGLLLFRLARRAHSGRRWAAFWFWVLVILLASAIGVAWVFRPTILYAVAYGCEVGAGVLLVMLLFQALRMERYRRQIVFLPNFRRARTGSSLVRANGSLRPANEPSTIDAPRAAGSSQQPGERAKQ